MRTLSRWAKMADGAKQQAFQPRRGCGAKPRVGPIPRGPTLGKRAKVSSNLEEVVAPGPCGHNLFEVENVFGRFTQGSSFVATLGFGTQPLRG